ncbi:monocarboxylate transporter 12-B-like [Panulirus ornatus]|uniref:monocarboxylate transporter 12-B-like n=1 Tax=Panulirus ornatus TaxID=150431 RepID=UPI003A8618A2
MTAAPCKSTPDPTVFLLLLEHVLKDMACKCTSYTSYEDVFVDKICCNPCDGERSVYERGLSEEAGEASKETTNGDAPCKNTSKEVEIYGKEDTVTEDDEKSRAPDSGWGWVVVFGASLILVLVDTIGQCFGIIFSTFLLKLKTSSTMTAWIFNIFGFMWSMTGPPLGSLISEFGWRKVAFVGGIMLSVSTITSAFVTSAWVLFFTHSILGGIACGVLSNISYVIVPHYFSKRRGLANGLTMAWDCGGQLLGPPLIHYLQSEYGFDGATLILGGIVLHCCVGAAVFHPVEWHVKSHLCHTVSNKNVNVDQHCDTSSTSECHWKWLVRLTQSTIADLYILRSARALIIALGATFIFNSYLNFLAFVPFSMQESGFGLQDAAWCVSVSAMCNMLTRIVISSLTDTCWFNFQICYLFASFTIAVSMTAFILVRDLQWKLVVMAVWGCGVGSYMSIFNLVMVHYMGLDNFMSTFGAAMLCIAVGYITIGPCVGYIRDATGGYTITVFVLTAMVAFSFIMWFFMPSAIVYDKNRSTKKDMGKTP